MQRFICLGFLVAIAFAGPVVDENPKADVVDKAEEVDAEEDDEAMILGSDDMAQLMYGQGPQQVQNGGGFGGFGGGFGGPQGGFGGYGGNVQGGGYGGVQGGVDSNILTTIFENQQRPKFTTRRYKITLITDDEDVETKDPYDGKILSVKTPQSFGLPWQNQGFGGGYGGNTGGNNGWYPNQGGNGGWGYGGNGWGYGGNNGRPVTPSAPSGGEDVPTMAPNRGYGWNGNPNGGNPNGGNPNGGYGGWGQ